MDMNLTRQSESEAERISMRIPMAHQVGRTGRSDSGTPMPATRTTSPSCHPSSARFYELLKEAGDLHRRKQADYGRGDDPFANVRASTSWGVPAWVGAMIRLNDKVARLQTLAQGGKLRNEGALDSFMDIAVYALIAHVLYEQEPDPDEDI